MLHKLASIIKFCRAKIERENSEIIYLFKLVFNSSGNEYFHNFTLANRKISLDCLQTAKSGKEECISESEKKIIEAKAKIIAKEDSVFIDDDFVELFGLSCWGLHGEIYYFTKHGRRTISIEQPKKCFEVLVDGHGFVKAVELPKKMEFESGNIQPNDSFSVSEKRSRIIMAPRIIRQAVEDPYSCLGFAEIEMPQSPNLPDHRQS